MNKQATTRFMTNNFKHEMCIAASRIMKSKCMSIYEYDTYILCASFNYAVTPTSNLSHVRNEDLDLLPTQCLNGIEGR